MSKNYLLIVEGKKTEPNVFERVFERYGFRVKKGKEPLNITDVGQFEKIEFSLNQNNVVIIQGPKNRIHDFLLLIEKEDVVVEKLFKYQYAFFNSIFLIYDVDHNDCEDIEKMFNYFNDETTSGLLLLSSPCIEVLEDYNRERREETYHKIEEYKKDINIYWNGLAQDNLLANFESTMLHFLEKNQKDFAENNIMEHPRLIIDKINKLNERVNCSDKEKSYVRYRYFSTVVYVAIANANGLTKEIDNYSKACEFFENKKQ